MTLQIKPWGNSNGIRITQEMLKASGLKINEDLEVSTSAGRILIERAHPRLSLEERIEKYGPLIITPEIDWGEPAGNEVW